MKILLICAAGMSTSILMKKMEQYANDQGIDLDIKAVGLMDYQDVLKTNQAFYCIRQGNKDTKGGHRRDDTFKFLPDFI